MQDIAQALSNSLDCNGAGGMRAALDMGGNQIRNAAPGVLPTDVATVGQSGVPVGVYLPYAGAVLPAGYLFCYGQPVSRTEYADLFAVIGIAYGHGDGSLTFNVPDMRGNVAVGRDNMGGTAAGRISGATAVGGQIGSQSVSLTIDQIPSHSHPVNDPGHLHGGGTLAGTLTGGSGANFLEEGQAAPNYTRPQMDMAQTGITVGSVGAGNSHPNIQPSLVGNYIIKAML